MAFVYCDHQYQNSSLVSIARTTGTLVFLARFMFVAAMNPCPCGYFGDPVRECTCSTSTVIRALASTMRATIGTALLAVVGDR